MLKVYYADISQLKITKRMKSYFSELRLEKMQKTNDKQACAGVEALLCYALGKKPCYTYGENGKPYFTDSDLYFNLSHSGEYVACALSDAPVGVDIQQVREYKETTAKRIFSKYEFEQLQKSDNKEKIFCSIWAQKEACVKLSGKGIAELFSSNAETAAYYKEFNGYALAVCGREEAEFIEVSADILTEFFEGMK